MIKSIRISLFFLLISNVVLAQRFTETQQMDLPDTVSAIQAEWVDMDNDGLLDILIIAENQRGQYFYTYKNDTISGFSFIRAQPTGFTDAIYFLHDYDGDNKMDVAVSGKKLLQSQTSICINQGSFVFSTESDPLIMEMGNCIQFSDFNNDGRNELVVSGENINGPFFSIYTKRNGNWEIANDSLKVTATDMRAFDFNGDLFNDVIISGLDTAGEPYLVVQYSDGGFNFKNFFSFPIPIDGSIAIGDISNDGLFDLIVAGKKVDGSFVAYQAINQKGSFELSETSQQLEKPSSFIADIDIDGIVDFNFIGLVGNDTVNVLEQSALGFETIIHEQLILQRFGDFDHDGDLDILQVTEEVVKILSNVIEVVNEEPGKPPFTFSASIYNRTFFYWDKSIDDHTNSLSLTYDLFLQEISRNVITPEFNVEGKHRLTVSHGNIGTNNYTLINVPFSEYTYEIQAVDNSFHAGNVCVGGGGGGGGCQVPMTFENLTACKSEEISLSAENEVLWFSFADGFLGAHNSLTFTPEKSDTLFYYDRNAAGDCGTLKVFVLAVTDSLVRESFSSRYVCLDEIIEFSVTNQWDSIAWSSTKLGFFSNESVITFTATEKDTIQAYLLNKPSCIDIRKTELIISIPEVSVNGEVFQIMKGSSVQLEASGGETYSWSPPTGLSNSEISNPIATPTNTIEYQVSVGDSLGCTALKKVLVKVEETAFIPSLFTPNQDGNNDYLKVYGLIGTSGFTLKIYNREGNAVFETSDPTTDGWDGTRGGMEQPNGVYYWKVAGSYTNGATILLNGKTSGSVVLMR